MLLRGDLGGDAERLICGGDMERDVGRCSGGGRGARDLGRIGGDGGCAAGGGVVVVGQLPLSKSYMQVGNHFRPILKLVPALTLDGR